MEGLIKIEKSQGGKQVVSARELYDFLELDKSHWTRWYKKNIIDNPFALENQDWVGFAIMANGNETKDFSVTVDFAKRLAMMTRTEKGESARNYFIECEKKMNALSMPNFTDPAEAAEAWAKEYRAKQKALEEKKQLELKVQEDAPKVEFFDDLVDRKLNLNFRTTAKEIGVKESVFIQYLLDKKYIYRGSGNKLFPYAQYVGEDSLFVVKEQKTEKWAGTQTLITPKGRARFLILLGDKGQHLLN